MNEQITIFFICNSKFSDSPSSTASLYSVYITYMDIPDFEVGKG